MAKVLDQLPVTKRGGKDTWSKYCDGQVWLLKRGEDFRCRVSSADTSFRHAATKLGKRAAVRRVGSDSIAVQALPKETHQG